MVQLRVDSVSSTIQHQEASYDQYPTSIDQEYSEESRKVDDLNSLSCTATQLSLLAWTAMLERSNKRLEKFSHSSLETITNISSKKASNLNQNSIDTSSPKDSFEKIPPSSKNLTYTNLERPMQKQTVEGSVSDQNSYLAEYQESLMNTCSEIIDSLSSTDKNSEDITKHIKIERSGSTEQDDWISGFSEAISTDTANETNITIKQELQSDEAAFSRTGTRSSYNQHHNPLSLMPPTSTNSSGHESGVRSNSISSVSGESAIDTEMSCTTPSPSSMPTSSSSSTNNTLSTFNVQSQINHPSTAASSSMVMRQTQGSPSTNPSSIMASPNASTSSAQHSFTLTPLGPHITSGYGGISGSSSSSYFPSGCGSTSGSRFGNPNQQHHNFDGSFHSSWTTPFGSSGIGRTNYNGIPQFMSGQNQVFSGSPFQNNVVSNTEGSSPFFTHGSGGGGLISPSSNSGQNADRSSRGGDSNESSPHGVNSGSNSPHLSHGLFGHDEGHGSVGGAGSNVGVIGGNGSRKREIRLIKNREAARECRRKKKEYIKCLENRVAVLENQNKALIEELKSLKSLYNTASSSTKMPSNEGMKGNKI